MDEQQQQPDEPGTRRSRSFGVRYPGASLPEAMRAAMVIAELGDTALIGTLAARLNLSETNSDFLRLLASLRSYGLADYGNAARSTLSLTDEGRAAVSGEPMDRTRALGRALLRPDVFQRVAKRFEGRALPAGDGLAEAFKVEGVAASAAPLAARNFAASAQAAQLLETQNGRPILSVDLPYPTTDGETKPQTITRPMTVKGPLPVPAQRPLAPMAAARAGPDDQRAAAGRSTIGPQVPAYLPVTINIDASGWTADQVLELIAKLRKPAE